MNLRGIGCGGFKGPRDGYGGLPLNGSEFLGEAD